MISRAKQIERTTSGEGDQRTSTTQTGDHAGGAVPRKELKDFVQKYADHERAETDSSRTDDSDLSEDESGDEDEDGQTRWCTPLTVTLLVVSACAVLAGLVLLVVFCSKGDAEDGLEPIPQTPMPRSVRRLKYLIEVTQVIFFRVGRVVLRCS